MNIYKLIFIFGVVFLAIALFINFYAVMYLLNVSAINEIYMTKMAVLDISCYVLFCICFVISFNRRK